ncbi:SDR family NAD(P)-dependent oxidoreductase [Pseudochrobactrum sp. sp1633]|uniref:SDR family NAD(P)-dependent oxidoreductase n=1 Tax=Pseudochrobactrum sp. sp1633 TaxID=3036706 RepID=UPI0025A5F64B|nr:SDR family oxidoreductase [Pseudochrobactrum sp. sp1633]MDM8345973.1 SDR family NAD(P)-dependent oxidoreductase [Pseudochrobactrum sp. sp1633]HWD12164.1 SDR family oxidoreductase [Pseudochrobactrum sp.]
MSANSQNLFSVEGKVIAVTGGSSGLGHHMVHTLAAHGAKVVSIARSHVPHCCPDCDGTKPDILHVHADVSDKEEICAAFDQAEKCFGPVSVVFNNAGIACKASALKTTSAMMEQVFAVNVVGAFNVAQEAARRMIAANLAGAIINTTSILGNVPQKGAIAYSMSKAALTQMTRSLALEWAAHNIRVNAIAPGWFPTGINQDLMEGPAHGYLKAKNPMRRLGENCDLEGALLLLASNAGGYMTGTTITIDGGHSLQS